jgi:myo-inositol 2-dehydrogenase / D-chiro-inositol 1-dehydrogenase
MQPPSESSRRDFLKRSATATAAGALASIPSIARTAHAAGSDQFNVALVGAGNRGTGAAADCLNVAKNVRLVAVADIDEDRARLSLKLLKEAIGEQQVAVPEEQLFAGLEAYKKALACDVDLVIFATPPGFRPMHYRAAVEANKHVFLEKPCCVDAVGYRSLLETNELADAKGLKVGVGFFRRHFPQYVEAVQRIHDGGIGDVSLMRCYANMSRMPTRSRLPDTTEMQYQVRNWHVFDWIGGGRLVEMHCHGLDAMNWIKQAHPVEVNGMGGRQTYDEARFGQDYDHHFNEFTYADGSKMYSQCRQMNGCWTSVTENIHGAQGQIGLSGFIGEINRLRDRERVNPYQKEHIDLLDAIRTGKPYNEGGAGATSSFTAVIARMANYSGKVIKWDEAAEMGPSLFPEEMSWDADAPVMPDENGRYDHAVAMPGIFKPYS